MSKFYKELNEKLREFIENQKIFYVGTAAPEGRINLSPKGMDSLRILNANQLIWLNLTGSGNETAAHVLEQPRMTLMFCSFEGKPLIIRVYGKARAIHPRDDKWAGWIPLFPEYPGTRQIFCLMSIVRRPHAGSQFPTISTQRIGATWSTGQKRSVKKE